MYDTKTLEIKSISPVCIESLNPEHKVHKIKFKDVKNILEVEDHPSNYLVDVSKEYAKLVHNLWSLGDVRSIAYSEMLANKSEILSTDNIVNDLNFRNYFFEYFRIAVEQAEDFIELKFNIAEVGTDIESRFNMSITEDNGKTTLYVTKFRDPTCLLFTHEINVNDFKHTSTIKIPGSKEKVTVWAAKHN